MNSSWTPDWARGMKKAPDIGSSSQVGSPETADQHPDPQVGTELALPVSADIVLEALREVEDPELGISIVELGLIYGVDVDKGKVRVIMTLTSPGCPIGPTLQAAVHGAAKRVYPGAEDIKVDLVWSPPWDPYQMASEEAKDMLGIW